jgi:predicted nuclease of predicted toxin-antitoxin system
MIRFLADADLKKGIVAGCLRREPTMDFLSATEANLEGVPDPEVLALAAEQNRVLVSHDLRTMLRHFGDFLQARGSNPGVLIVPQSLPIGEAIEELLPIWGASEAEEWENRIVRIPQP